MTFKVRHLVLEGYSKCRLHSQQQRAINWFLRLVASEEQSEVTLLKTCYKWFEFVILSNFDDVRQHKKSVLVAVD